MDIPEQVRINEAIFSWLEIRQDLIFQALNHLYDEKKGESTVYDKTRFSLSEMPLCEAWYSLAEILPPGFELINSTVGRVRTLFHLVENPSLEEPLPKEGYSHTYAYNPETDVIICLTPAQSANMAYYEHATRPLDRIAAMIHMVRDSANIQIFTFYGECVQKNFSVLVGDKDAVLDELGLEYGRYEN